MITLDSGAVTALASSRAYVRISKYRQLGMGPFVIPAVVLVECLTGDPGRDAPVNMLIKACLVEEDLSEEVARHAALLRTLARRGSAVDALVVACAEKKGGRVLTEDHKDLGALAEHTRHVLVERI